MGKLIGEDHRVGGCAVGSDNSVYAPGAVLLVQSRATA